MSKFYFEMTSEVATDWAIPTIRTISEQNELRAVEELQKEVWEIPDLDVVPLTQIVAAVESGGVLIGAFDRNVLVGFAYGFVGFENGKTTHHSHMLAVKPGYRNHNLGYKLKLAQREFVLSQGIDEMTWTFDPLQSVNAYFNFNRLGVVSNKYLIDFYGADAASSLHRNGTDRLWVTWKLKSKRVAQRIENSFSKVGSGKSKALVEVGKDGSPKLSDRTSTDLASIEIPSNIGEIERQSHQLASDWREVTRTAFTEAISDGFIVVDFARNELAGKYLLVRG